MRRRIRDSVGVLLIIGGGLLILQNLNVFSGKVENIIWAIILSAMGGFFLSRYFSKRENWGWLIPGITILGIGISNLVELIPGAGEKFSDLLILSSIGLSFFLIYLNDRLHWWALVPGGLLISLGVGSFVDAYEIGWIDSESILFLGLGVTFLILYILPTTYGRLKWALIPAVILLVLGSVVAVGETLEIGEFVGPAIIIVLGLLVLFNAFRK